MEITPKVSIIIPVYNVEQYLRQCLDSIRQQTLDDIEIICVDDGSTDDSSNILDLYAQQDNRFVVLHQENKGAGAARNKGLDIAHGEYLLFLDADDFFEQKMLEVAYEKACQVHAEIVIFRADRYLQAEDKFLDITSINYKLLPNRDPFAAADVERNIFRSVVGWTWDKLFLRSFINKYNIRFQEIRVHNDLLFTYAALVSASRITLVDQKFTHQRKRGGGSISDEFKEWWCTFDALKALKYYLECQNLYTRFGKDFINYAAYLLLYNLNRLHGEAVRKFQGYMRQVWMRELGIEDALETDFYDKSLWEQCRRIAFSIAPVCSNIKASKKPKISVIVPSLNSGKYIDECVTSILSQTLIDIEVLCIDAGSTDGTVEKLNAYAKQDSRVRIFHSAKKSYGYQINLGLDKAQGEFFAIVESDDYILSNMYEVLFDLAQKFQLDSVKSDFCVFFGEANERTFTNRYLIDDKKKYNKVLNPSEDITLFKANNVNPPGIYSLDFIRQNHIRLNETSGASYQDNGLWFQIFAQSKRMYFYPRPFYMIRRDNPDSSVKSTGKVFCSCREYDFIREFLKKTPELERKFASLCALYRHNNYNFTLNRIAPEYQLGFLKKYSEDFIEIEYRGELDKSLFSTAQWKTLRQIMDNPDLFYRKKAFNIRNYAAVEPVANVFLTQDGEQYKVKVLQRKLDDANKEIANIHRSWTYRIGRFMTWIPRKIRGCILCYEEHGLYYTWNRLLIHLHLRKEHNYAVPMQVAKQSAKKVEESIPPKKDYNFFKSLSAKQYPEELRLWYQRTTNLQLNLEQPKTFNEKIQWLKLYDSTELKTRLADKYLVRDWVKEKIGAQYLIPLLGVWDKFEDIDFSELPDSFVLKANHGCGWNIIVKDKSKFNIEDAREKFHTWLNLNFAFRAGLELQYMNIPPKIIAEEYLENGNNDLYDYKVFCFDGKAESIMFLSERKQGLKMAFYDLEWNKLPFVYTYPQNELDIPKPQNLDLLIQLSEKLAEGFAHVRVDFYILNDGSLKFGEMTFTSASGNCKWNPPEQDRIYGDLIKLPPKSPIPERKVF